MGIYGTLALSAFSVADRGQGRRVQDRHVLRQADEPAVRAVARRRGGTGHHRLRRRPGLARPEREASPSTSRPRARAATPGRRTSCSARSATSPRASRSAWSAHSSATPRSPTTRRSPAGWTRRCRRCCEQPFGPVLLGAIGLGLICYGLFCFARSPAPDTCPADRTSPGGVVGMTTRDVDVVVLGLGPGGEHAAIKLGRAGLDVVAVESRLVGGECPYYGCVPSKMMIAAAHQIAEVHRVPEFGGTAQVQPDWSAVAARVRDEATDDWNDAAAVDRLEESGVRFVRGHGRLDRTRPGRGRRDDVRRREGRGAQHRHRARRPADRRAGGDAVLDQPRRGAADRDPGIGRGARRRAHRLRVRAGVLPVRRPGHRGRGRGPARRRRTSPRRRRCWRRRSPPRGSRC